MRPIFKLFCQRAFLSVFILPLISSPALSADEGKEQKAEAFYTQIKALSPPAQVRQAEDVNPPENNSASEESSSLTGTDFSLTALKTPDKESPLSFSEKIKEKTGIDFTIGGYADIYGGATHYKDVLPGGENSAFQTETADGKERKTKNVNRGNAFFDGDLFIAAEKSFSEDFSVGARADGKIYLDAGNAPHARVRLEDAYMQLSSGTFGRLMVGKTDNAAVLMHYSAPDVSPLGVNDSNLNRFIYFPGRNIVRSERPTYPISTALNGEGNDFKINYFTPELNGFSFGVSYISKGDSYDKNLYVFQTGAEHKAGYLASAGYLNTFSGFGVGLSGAAAFYEGKEKHQDRMEYSVGANISYKDFTVGGAWRLIEYNSDKTDLKDGYAFNAGISYNNHLFGASAAYIQGVTKSKPYEETVKLWQTSFVWHYRPQLDLFLTLARQKYGLDRKITGISAVSGLSYTF